MSDKLNCALSWLDKAVQILSVLVETGKKVIAICGN